MLFWVLFSIFFRSWTYLGSNWLNLQDALKTPPRPPKTPPRAPKTPPRASKMPPRRSRGTPNSFILLCFFYGFAFLGLLGTSLTQHGLQDASKTLQDASQNLQDASKTPPDASKTAKIIAKTRPRPPTTPMGTIMRPLCKKIVCQRPDYR